MFTIRMLTVVCLTLSSVAAMADTAGCQLEHGYLVCHATTASANQVTLSFAPVRTVTAATTDALVCSTNTSGVASVAAGLSHGFGDQIAITANDQGNGCADLVEMNFNTPGWWTLVVTFRDGDRAAFSFVVQ